MTPAKWWPICLGFHVLKVGTLRSGGTGMHNFVLFQRREKTYLTNPKILISHILQHITQNRNVHISVMNCGLWDFLLIYSDSLFANFTWILWAYYLLHSKFLHREPRHDDVMKWKHFPRYWLFMRGIHRSPVNSPHNGEWRGAFIFSLIGAWINGWVINGEAGNLRCHCAHYDVTVMSCHHPNQLPPTAL